MRFYIQLIFLRLMAQLSVITRKSTLKWVSISTCFRYIMTKRTHQSTHEFILEIESHSLDKYLFFCTKAHSWIVQSSINKTVQLNTNKTTISKKLLEKCLPLKINVSSFFISIFSDHDDDDDDDHSIILFLGAL